MSDQERTYTAEEIRQAVMEYPQGCEEQKRDFLRTLGINSERKRIVVTFEVEFFPSVYTAWGTLSTIGESFVADTIERGLEADNQECIDRGKHNLWDVNSVQVLHVRESGRAEGCT